MPFISVVSIAGPGDSFADPERTLTTLELIRKSHPELQLCISTNGLGVAEHIDALAELKVGFVTVTINAVDPQIGAMIYTWVGSGGTHPQGVDAASFLIERQLEAVARLKTRGIIVKVNTVVIPGVNDTHCLTVAERVSFLKVDLQNLIALIPVSGTPLQDSVPPAKGLIASLRRAAQCFLPQMRHCARCRSDAVGLVHDDMSCSAPSSAIEPVVAGA